MINCESIVICECHDYSLFKMAALIACSPCAFLKALTILENPYCSAI